MLVSGVYHQYISDNIRLSKERCQSEIETIYSSIIGDKVKNGKYDSLDQFLEDLQAARKQYKSSAKVLPISEISHTF